MSEEDSGEPHEVSSPCQVIINALLSPMHEVSSLTHPPFLPLVHPSPPPSSPCQVIVNALLSPMQERNLSAALGGREVVDRVGVILGEQEGQA